MPGTPLLRTVLWVLLAVVLTGAMLWFVGRADTSLPRQALSVIYLFFLPGMIWVRLLRLPDVLNQIALAFVLSLTMNILVSLGLGYAGQLTGENGLQIMVLLTTPALVLDLLIAVWATFRQRGDYSAAK